MTEQTMNYTNQIAEVNRMLEVAYARFELLIDPDLIESEIYNIKCLQAKQSHLLKMARAVAG